MMMEDDYEVFIPLYEDGLIFRRWKSSVDREGYTYFDTFKEAKADLISYYENTIQACEVLLRKAREIKVSIEHEVVINQKL